MTARVLVAALAATGAVATAAGAAAPKRLVTCATLNGTVVVGTPQVRIVDRATDGTHRYSGCVPGKSARVVSISSGGGSLTFGARRFAIVVARDRRGAQTVWNLHSGSHYALRRGTFRPLGSALVTGSGEAVAAFKGPGGTAIVAFAATGAPVVLDSGIISSASLRLRDTTAHWTKGGAAREASVVTTRRTCSQLSSDADDQYGAVTVTTTAWAQPAFLPGLDGMGYRYLACVRPDGPVQQIAATRGNALGAGNLRVSRVVGHRVAFALTYISSLGTAADRQLGVADLDLGTTAMLWRAGEGHNAAFGTFEPGTGESADAVFITPAGHVAAVFHTADSSQLAIFQRDGQGYVIDTARAGKIDPALISLTGSVLHWDNDGHARVAELDNAPWPPVHLPPPT